MKLVTEFDSLSKAYGVQNRLREAGVMTTLTGVETSALRAGIMAAAPIGLWVVFDDQCEDAVRLLEDPDHVPERVITIEEMEEIESSLTDDE